LCFDVPHPIPNYQSRSYNMNYFKRWIFLNTFFIKLRISSLCHHIQTCCGAHPPSCFMGASHFSPGIRHPIVKLKPTCVCCGDQECRELYSTLPYAFMECCLTAQIGNITFNLCATEVQRKETNLQSCCVH